MLADSLSVLVQGVVLGVSLCCTLGPQSVFVLRQGIRRQAAIEVAAVCSAADFAMIVAGAVGFGALVAAFPALAQRANWIGAVLILAYGAKMLVDSARNAAGDRSYAARGRSGAVAIAVALSVLNPQVYLEMVGVVGSVAMRFAGADRAAFALGVMMVSPLWFFGLALGGSRMAALVSSRRLARAVDLTTASLMLGLGATLALAEAAGP
jgi:L-lysine exporter family protein LysE/ArgO